MATAVREVVVHPDQGDLEEALRMLSRGDTIVVGSSEFVEQIQVEAPYTVDVKETRGGTWRLARKSPFSTDSSLWDLRRYVSGTVEWKRYVERLHDDAGQLTWDEALVRFALSDLSDEIERIIEDRMAEGNIRRAGIVQAYLDSKKATAGTVAGTHGHG